MKDTIIVLAVYILGAIATSLYQKYKLKQPITIFIITSWLGMIVYVIMTPIFNWWSKEESK